MIRPGAVVQPAGVVDGDALAFRGLRAAADFRICDLQAGDVVHEHSSIPARAGGWGLGTGNPESRTSNPNHEATRTSLPMWLLDSMTRCASAASRSGNVACTIGFTAPDSSSGHT